MNFDEFMKKECPALVPPTLPYGLTLADLAAEFGPDPEWPKLKNNPRGLHHLAEGLHTRRLRERGEAPPTFTAIRNCAGCGPVFLEPWTQDPVEGCPWCLNRDKGLPIPRPKFQERRRE